MCIAFHTHNQQYNSVYSIPHPQSTIHNPVSFFADDPNNPATLPVIDVTAEDITKAIKQLKLNSAPGPDGVPAILILKCSEALAHPLLKLWWYSLDTGTVPTHLKNATVCPIYKGGDRSTHKNYRPVALTSRLIKVFEKCARNKIIAHMEEHTLHSDNEHGFRKGRSCLLKLLPHYDWILQNLGKGKNVDVVFLDFAKAFDKVDHSILLHKIKSMEITGKLGLWLHNFLPGRTQSVTVNGHKCEEAEVVSGVAQGSMVGPLVFLIHMGDIGERWEILSSPPLLMTPVSAIQLPVWKSTPSTTSHQHSICLDCSKQYAI